MLNNMTIKSRLVFVIGLLSLLLVGVGGLGLYGINKSNESLRGVYGVLSPNPRNFQNGKFSRWPTSNARVMPWRVLL